MGPFDGHDIAEIEKALENAGEFDGPVVLHVQTQKGRGYGPAENDSVKHMHDIGPSKPKPESYTAAFSETVIKLAEEHPDLVAITAAMPDSTGLLPFGERYPDRLIDVGIAEQHAVTMAAGMAMGGLRPVVALYSTFLTRAFDQANLDVGLHGQPVIFCLDRAGITGDDGPSHHGILDLVLMSKIPGMTILCPSSYQELQQMLSDAYDITSRPGLYPLAEDPTPDGRRRRGRPVAEGPPGPRGHRRVPDRGRQDVRPRPRRRPTCWPPTGSRPRSGIRGRPSRSTRRDARPRRRPPPRRHRRGRTGRGWYRSSIAARLSGTPGRTRRSSSPECRPSTWPTARPTPSSPRSASTVPAWPRPSPPVSCSRPAGGVGPARDRRRSTDHDPSVRSARQRPGLPPAQLAVGVDHRPDVDPLGQLQHDRRQPAAVRTIASGDLPPGGVAGGDSDRAWRTVR